MHFFAEFDMMVCMAEIQTTTLIDDLTGEALEPENAHRITFAVDGRTYRIDLDQGGADTFRAALEPYVKAATVLGAATTPRPRRSRQAGAGNGEQTKMREWARANGHEVAERGRIPKAVQDAYRQAH